MILIFANINILLNGKIQYTFKYTNTNFNIFFYIMKNCYFSFNLDICSRHLLGPELAGLSPKAARKYDRRVSDSGRWLASVHLETRFVFQKCQESHFPRHECPEPLFMALLR